MSVVADTTGVMSEFTESPPISWEAMAAWLADSLSDKPTAFVLDMGPNSYLIEGDDDEEVVCAQAQVLADGVLMLRRSRSVLGHLLIGDYSVDGLELDRWHYDDRFDDCTDGYLFSRDAGLIADLCVTWFRDNWGAASTADLGCEYRFPDVLGRTG